MKSIAAKIWRESGNARARISRLIFQNVTQVEKDWEYVPPPKGSLTEAYLLNIVKKIFPLADVRRQFRHNSKFHISGNVIELINPETRQFLELDIYIPKLNLALEYQVQSSEIRFLLHRESNTLCITICTDLQVHWNVLFITV